MQRYRERIQKAEAQNAALEKQLRQLKREQSVDAAAGDEDMSDVDDDEQFAQYLDECAAARRASGHPPHVEYLVE